MLPTLEQTLPQYGVTTDSIRTTPLSGQPDLLGGLSPQVEALLQGQVEQTYARFLGLVAKARGKTSTDIDKIAQGRIWDGGTARQLGLVDQFGGLDDAVAWVASQAKAETFHAEYIADEPSPFAQLLRQMETGEAPEARAHDLAGALAAQQHGLMARMQADVMRLMEGGGIRAYCLECAGEKLQVSKLDKRMDSQLPFYLWPWR